MRELRHTTAVNTQSDTALDVDVSRRGANCASSSTAASPHPLDRGPDALHPRAGRRRDRRPGGPRRRAATFTYTPASGTARHVMVRLELAPDGGRSGGYRESIVITDGTELRNVP